MLATGRSPVIVIQVLRIIDYVSGFRM